MNKVSWLVASLALVACESAPPPPPADAGNDSGTDSVTDAALDAAGDDANTADAGSDAGLGSTRARRYGGSGNDRALDAVIDDEDNVYILGWTSSTNGDLAGRTNAYGDTDVWVLKLSPAGDILFSSIVSLDEDASDGEHSQEDGRAIALGAGGVVLVAGSTTVFDTDANTYDDSDALVAVLDREDGHVIRTVNIGGDDSALPPNEDDDDVAEEILDLTLPGPLGTEYKVVGSSETHESGAFGTNWNDGTLAASDGFVATIDANGLVGATLYGGEGPDVLQGLVHDDPSDLLPDRYIGSTSSDATGVFVGTTPLGYGDIWSMTSTGSSRHGGDSSDGVRKVRRDALVGSSGSTGCAAYGDLFDAMVVDLALGGFTRTCFGGPGIDVPLGVARIDDDLLVVGSTTSAGMGDFGGQSFAGTDAFLARISAASVVSMQVLGGNNADELVAVLVANDDSIVLVGRTRSTDAHLPPALGGDDVWVRRQPAPADP